MWVNLHSKRGGGLGQMPTPLRSGAVSTGPLPAASILSDNGAAGTYGLQKCLARVVMVEWRY